MSGLSVVTFFKQEELSVAGSDPAWSVSEFFKGENFQKWAGIMLNALFYSATSRNNSLSEQFITILALERNRDESR